MGNSSYAFQPHLIALRTDPATLYLVAPAAVDPTPVPDAAPASLPPASIQEVDTGHPTLQQMAGSTSQLMLIVLTLLALGLLALIGLPLLFSS